MPRLSKVEKLTEELKGIDRGEGVPEPEQKTTPEPKVRAERKVRTEPPPIAKGPRKIRKVQTIRDVGVGDENFTHMFVSPLAGIASSQVDIRFRPTSTEIDDIFRPLERFALRRLPVDLRNKTFDELDADKRDLALAAGGMIAYAARVITNPSPSSSRGPVIEPKRRGNDGGDRPKSGPDVRPSGGTEADTSSSNGNAGAVLNDAGIAIVDDISTIDPQSYAKAAMADLWRESYKPDNGE